MQNNCVFYHQSNRLSFYQGYVILLMLSLLNGSANTEEEELK